MRVTVIMLYVGMTICPEASFALTWGVQHTPRNICRLTQYELKEKMKRGRKCWCSSDVMEDGDGGVVNEAFA